MSAPPKTIIHAGKLPRLTKEQAAKQLKLLGAAFIADDDTHKGPWTRLYAAKQELKDLVVPAITGSASHRAGVDTEDELRDFLVKHRGLNGEFGNGPAQAIEANLRTHPRYAPKFYAARIAAVFRSFAEPSQAAVTNISKKASISREFNLDPANNIFAGETKLQAIPRMADEIEAWMEHNRDNPPPELTPQCREKIAAQLALYREAFQEVEAFLADARPLLQAVHQPVVGFGRLRAR